MKGNILLPACLSVFKHYLFSMTLYCFACRYIEFNISVVHVCLSVCHSFLFVLQYRDISLGHRSPSLCMCVCQEVCVCVCVSVCLSVCYS